MPSALRNLVRLRHVAAAGALGLITTISVAWVSVLRVDLYHADPRPGQLHSSGAAPAWSYSHWRSCTGQGILSIDSGLSGAPRTADFAPGPSWSRTSRAPVTVPGEEFSARYEEARGWPFPSLLSVHASTDMSLTTWRTRTGIALKARSGIFDVPRTLGVSPIMPGLVVNTLVFAGAWLLVIVLTAFMFKIRRRRAGVCVRCGYAVTGLPRCPECGAERL